jgi:hypothetical protein
MEASDIAGKGAAVSGNVSVDFGSVDAVFRDQGSGAAQKGDNRPQKIDKSNVATARQLKEILERQEYRCALSGVKLEPQDASLDHIVPVSKGGSNSADNLQFLHKDVNRAKFTMSQQDFIKMCARVAEYSR